MLDHHRALIYTMVIVSAAEPLPTPTPFTRASLAALRVRLGRARLGELPLAPPAVAPPGRRILGAAVGANRKPGRVGQARAAAPLRRSRTHGGFRESIRSWRHRPRGRSRGRCA